MPETVTVGAGIDPYGVPWKVGAVDGVLAVDVDGNVLILSGAHREAFAEAVARACAPGQASVVCWHCRKPIVRCASVAPHAGCASGHGWIHSNPEQWGHSCEPRSGAPYARPAMPGQVNG